MKNLRQPLNWRPQLIRISRWWLDYFPRRNLRPVRLFQLFETPGFDAAATGNQSGSRSLSVKLALAVGDHGVVFLGVLLLGTLSGGDHRATVATEAAAGKTPSSPNRRTVLARVLAQSASSATPRSSATLRAVWTT